MHRPCRSCWRNCALQADAEIIAIDRMQDELMPLDQDAEQIRQLITGLELCHHKAGRWVDNIIAAIGGGDTAKGLGTRSPGQAHPVEAVWRNACSALSAWCEGNSADNFVGNLPAAALIAPIGERSALKRWQLERVIEKIRGFIDWPRALKDPSLRYQPLLLAGGDYDCACLDRCPERYLDHEDFWLATVRTMIHDTDQERPAQLSLALAIDMLMPCHWRFVDNLQIVLGAIGGRLEPEQPFAACGRNIGLAPIRARMHTVSSTLKRFCGEAAPERDLDQDLLIKLGEPTVTKRWLAASLDKTIRLQLNPPAEVRLVSTLAGPDWLYQ